MVTNLNIIFFSVLRLLGSRQVVTQCLCHWTNCAKSCIFPHWGVERERGPVRSPSCPNRGDQRGKRPANKTTENKQKTPKNTTKTAKNNKHPVRWTCSVKDGSLCAGEFKRSCQKQSHNQPDITARSRRRCKTNKRSAVPKPRIPLARIPEIASWSHEKTAPSTAYDGRAMNWDATQRQAPCRGKRSKKQLKPREKRS